jgi:hypothetical protein
VRAIDERLLLQQSSHTGSLAVQSAGLIMTMAGIVLAVSLRFRRVEN